MKIVRVLSDDLSFPLGKGVWEDQNIWYHGTSSAFSKKIESEGWKAGELPYSMSDVMRVVEIYDTIRVRGTLQDFPQSFDSILYNYTIEGTARSFDKRAISLTRDYWRARNYAMNRGGETINALLEGAEYFSKTVNDKDCYFSHLQRLKQGIEDFHKRNDKEKVHRFNCLQDRLRQLKQCQRNFLELPYLQACVSELDNIRKKYVESLGGSYPVVYALKWRSSENTSNLEGTDPYNASWASYVETSRVRSSIPPSKIVGRVDFPAGIVKYYEVVLGHWIDKELLPWRR